MLTAQEMIWEGAGRPVVRDPIGRPLPEKDLGGCAFCGKPAVHRIKDCLSSNFVVCKQLRLGAQGLCKACAFCLRDLRLRCAPWFATPTDIRFCKERWGILDFLLNPPEPPFVAGVPWFGIGKGGLSNIDFCRVWHPGKEVQRLCPVKVDDATGLVVREPQILTKLQSKHTAIFAETSVSRTHYMLAIDDLTMVTVDVALWRRLALHITEALRCLPVSCLENWEPPTASQWKDGIIYWKRLTAPMELYRDAPWWSFLLAIVPRPQRRMVEVSDLPEKKHHKHRLSQKATQLNLF